MKEFCAVLLLLLQVVYELWQEYRAKISEEEKRVRDHQKTRLALYEAMEAKDSGRISRLGRDRAARLRLLLADGVPTPSDKPTD
jgi:hypothetical protein